MVRTPEAPTLTDHGSNGSIRRLFSPSHLKSLFSRQSVIPESPIQDQNPNVEIEPTRTIQILTTRWSPWQRTFFSDGEYLNDIIKGCLEDKELGQTFYGLRVTLKDPKTNKDSTITYYPNGELLSLAEAKKRETNLKTLDWKMARGLSLKFFQLDQPRRTMVEGKPIKPLDSENVMLVWTRAGTFDFFNERTCRLMVFPGDPLEPNLKNSAEVVPVKV